MSPEPRDHVAREQRQPEAELRKRFADRRRLHIAAPAEQHGDPGHDRADDHRGQAARHAERQAHVRHPADQDDRERHERDPGHLPHLEARPHRDERDRDARERAEHGRPRRVLANGRADERAEQHDHADDERPGQTRLPGQDRIVGLQVDRQHDEEHDDEHVRHARAVGHRRDAATPLGLGEAPGEESVVEIAERERDAERRQNAAVDDVLGHVHHAERQACEHDDIEQDVGEQPEEAVPVARHPQARPIVHCQRLLHSAPSDPSCVHRHRSRRNDAPRSDLLASPMPWLQSSSSLKNIASKPAPRACSRASENGHSVRPVSSTMPLPCPAQEDADNVPATVPTTSPADMALVSNPGFERAWSQNCIRRSPGAAANTTPS